MIIKRASEDRGYADHGWLVARHSFSFADYRDPEEMGWGVLRVINEDRVVPGTGFGTHGHRDMEIVTYVLDGELEHKDSLGNGGIIRRGEVQRMSAGKGILHSEFNPSVKHGVHLLQIWIEPAQLGGTPSYEQREIADSEKHGRLRLLVSPDGSDGSLRIGQDVRLYASLPRAGETLSHVLAPGRAAYLHLVSGQLSLNGTALSGGDGAKIADETDLQLVAQSDSEFLLFDLPPLH